MRTSGKGFGAKIMRREEEFLRNCLGLRGLKFTRQRQLILHAFLRAEKHITAEGLYRRVTKQDPRVGLATVYRTLALFCECGLARRHDFGEGQTRYEHTYGQGHHDHLICQVCGKVREFHDPMIEELQKQVSKQAGFTVVSHKLEIYGYCEECAPRKG